MTSQGGPSAVGQAAAGDAVASAPDAGPAGTGEQVAIAVDGAAPATANAAVSTDERTTTSGLQVTVAAQPYDSGPIWAVLLPPLIALGFAMWHITTPSYWRDEAATMAAVNRPFGDMLRMLGNVDAVHGAYYVIMYPLAHLFGTSELLMRMPSAIAVAVTAGFVAAIGRRMVTPWVGLAAGLLFAMLPVTSRFGQEARSYAMVMAIATVASYLLMRVFGAEGGRRRRWWLVGYGASLAVLGILNIFGLLLVPAHAVVVAFQLRRRGGGKEARKLAVGWLVAAVAGVALSSPVLVLGWQQRGQIAWLANARAATWPGDMSALATVTGSTLVTVVVAAVIVFALALSSDASGARRCAWRWPLAELAMPWMLVPPLLLIGASVISPIFTSRYVLMCIPAAALLGGMAIVSLGRVAGPVALALALLAGVSNQIDDRLPGGHSDNVRKLDIIVYRDWRPGDVVLYANPNAQSFSAAYSYGLGTLPDIAVKQAAIPSGTLAGTSVDYRTLRNRLRHAKRVWLIEINACVSEPLMMSLSAAPLGPAVEGLPLHFEAIWRRQNDWLFRYGHGAGNKRSTTACLRHT
jgi:mannosyltransferase